jgi:hypothetical protein
MSTAGYKLHAGMQAPHNPAALRPATRAKRTSRSAMGVGIAALVTTLVVLLLATFSVLSLVQARDDEHLARQAANSAEVYYQADSAATRWYAGVCKSAQPGTYEQIFAMDSTRELHIKVRVDAQGKAHIVQWQTVAQQH